MINKAAGIFLFLSLILPWTTYAQVAVPSIVPGGPRLFSARFPIAMQTSATTENPAALQWGAPGRIIYGTIYGNGNSPVASTLEGDIDGDFFGFRLVGENVSIALESANYTLASPANPVEEDTSSFILAFTGLDFLAWGVSLTTRDYQETTGTVDTWETQGKTAGLSWKILDWLYLGYALGREDESTLIGGVSDSLDRTFQMAGIGLRSGGGWIWHLEYSVITKDPYVGTAGTDDDGYELTQITVETNFLELTLAYTGYSISGSGSVAGAEIDGYTFDFAYAPLLGFALSFRYEDSTLVNSGVEFFTDKVHSITAAWQF